MCRRAFDFTACSDPQVEVKVAQTKEALAQQAGKARTAAFTHGYGTSYSFIIHSLLHVYAHKIEHEQVQQCN